LQHDGDRCNGYLRSDSRARDKAGWVMSAQPLFVLAYLSGAAALAAWFDLRLADRRPTRWGTVGIAIAASMLIDANIGAVFHLTEPIVSVMVLGFGALVFTLLAALWTLRMLRSAMPA
jgi:hypothetical protein